MATNINIACAMGDCTNPVIGQCRSCGRYYCASHNEDTLCLDCAHNKAEQERITDYLHTAERIKRETDKGYNFKKVVIGMAIGVTACFGAFGLFLTIGEGEGFGQALTMLLCSTMAVGLGLFGLKVENSRRLKRAFKKAVEVDKNKPGFLEFYKLWDSKKTKDEILETLNIGKKFATDFAGKAANSIINDK